jgi:transketolase
LVICYSHIAHGAPNKHDTCGAHGEPLGPDEVKAAKANLGLNPDLDFQVPEKVRALFAARLARLQRLAAKWQRDFDEYSSAHPDWLAQWNQFFHDSIPDNLEATLAPFDPAKPIATRAASGKVLQELAVALPQLVGGSADLAPSTKTLMDKEKHVGPGAFEGRNFHFGVREHGMCAILNGMALHGGLRVYGATFFVFLDYCRPSVRLAAMSKLPVIYVFTHDSFYVGEDGPTHEPVEHLATLRCIPGMTVIRPADANETAAAWAVALRNKNGPTALLLTRQNLPVLDRKVYPPAATIQKGAYTMWQTRDGAPDLLLIASGSEVELALRAAKALPGARNARVVNMASWELFDQQPKAYRDEVLPPACRKRLAIEAGSSMGWHRYVGSEGTTLCLDRFGASAPYAVLAKQFGFTPERIAEIVQTQLA